MDQKFLKGSSYLLVHGLERLKHEQIDYPKTLLETNEPLYIAYILEKKLVVSWIFRINTQQHVSFSIGLIKL